VALAGPYYLLALKVHSQTIADDVFQGTAGQTNPLAFYWLALPHQLGWVLGALCLLGAITARWWVRRDALVIMALWITSCYLTFAFLGQKEPRYIVYWLPPFLFFASGLLSWRPRIRWISAVSAVLVLGGIFASVWDGWRYQRPYVSGYQALVARLMQSPDPGVVLYDGRDGSDFIFFVRAMDTHRQWVVMRKGLYVTRVMKQYGARELVETKPQLEELFAEYGIRYVVVDDQSTDFPVQQLLRQVLKTPQFDLVERVPIRTNMPPWEGKNLFLYENREHVPRQTNVLRLRMLTLDHDIVVDLDDLQRK
jgi:hypothetical protein